MSPFDSSLCLFLLSHLLPCSHRISISLSHTLPLPGTLTHSHIHNSSLCSCAPSVSCLYPSFSFSSTSSPIFKIASSLLLSFSYLSDSLSFSIFHSSDFPKLHFHCRLLLNLLLNSFSLSHPIFSLSSTLLLFFLFSLLPPNPTLLYKTKKKLIEICLLLQDPSQFLFLESTECLVSASKLVTTKQSGRRKAFLRACTL